MYFFGSYMRLTRYITPIANRLPHAQYRPTPAGTIKAKYVEKAIMNTVMPHCDSLLCSI